MWHYVLTQSFLMGGTYGALKLLLPWLRGHKIDPIAEAISIAVFTGMMMLASRYSWSRHENRYHRLTAEDAPKIFE